MSKLRSLKETLHTFSQPRLSEPVKPEYFKMPFTPIYKSPNLNGFTEPSTFTTAGS